MKGLIYILATLVLNNRASAVYFQTSSKVYPCETENRIIESQARLVLEESVKRKRLHLNQNTLKVFVDNFEVNGNCQSKFATAGGEASEVLASE